jgi:hypothetical protein
LYRLLHPTLRACDVLTTFAFLLLIVAVHRRFQFPVHHPCGKGVEQAVERLAHTSSRVHHQRVDRDIAVTDGHLYLFSLSLMPLLMAPSGFMSSP